MALTVGGTPITAEQLATLQADLGIVVAEEITARITTLQNTDDAIFLRSGAPNLVSAAVIADYVGAPPAATAPAAFTSGQWTATAGDGQVTLNITALPSDGGSAITALRYRTTGSGEGTALTGTGTGERVISGLTNDVALDFQIAAVNAVGTSAWSDVKTRTPTAAATVPAAFTSGMWTATAGAESIVVNITSLPSNGGSAITALEYRLDGGSAVALTGTGTGSRTITGLTAAVEYDVELRAVNAVGAGAWGDLKSATPTAASSGGVWEGTENVLGALNASGLVATKPTGTASTDVLVAIVFGIVEANGITPPSGWTLIESAETTFGGLMTRAYWALGDVSSMSFARGTGDSYNVNISVHRVSGISTSTPIRESAFWNDVEASYGDFNNMPSPSVTAGAGDVILSWYHQVQTDNAVGTPTSGYTRVTDNSSPNRQSVVVRSGVSAGATGQIFHGAGAIYQARMAGTIALRAA